MGEGSETADDILSCLGQALGLEAMGRFHRHLAGKLEKVGHQHVQNGPGGFVEGRPHGHIEGFGHIDLHTLNMGVVPGSSEQAVGESQDMNVLRCFLPEKVIDSIDLWLLEDLVNYAIEVEKRLHRCAEGLFVDHPRPFGKTMGADRFGQRPECRGWNGHVVDQLWLAAQFPSRLLQDIEKTPRIGATEPTAGEAQSRAHLVPRPFRGLGTELLQALAGTFLKVLVGDLAASVRHQTPVFGEESGDGKTEESRQDEAMRQVSGASIQDEDRGLGYQTGIGHRELLGYLH